MRELQMMEDRILVVQDDADTTYGETLIAKPDSAKERPNTGRVLRVGPGRRTENGDLVPMSLKEGDLVVFAPYVGLEVNPTLDSEAPCGGRLVSMAEVDVLAKQIGVEELTSGS